MNTKEIGIYVEYENDNWDTEIVNIPKNTKDDMLIEEALRVFTGDTEEAMRFVGTYEESV